jgi:poly(3-hydroxybutyrate) depolymerase
MQHPRRFRPLTVLLCVLAGASAAPLQTQELALSQYSISVNGVERSYSYLSSTKANSYNGQWVVFALHDDGQSAAQFSEQSGWARVAEKYGFAVVFPQAVNNSWASNSGGEDAYIKAVFDHARTHLVSRYPGDNAAPGGGLPPGINGANNPIWAWEPLRDLTGSGAGARVAHEFAMNHPGLFAALATLNGVAFDAAYATGEQRAQDYFQHMRGKNLAPTWQQLKKEVPVSVWMFNSGAVSAAQGKQAAYWKASAAVTATITTRVIDGFSASIYANAANPAQEFRSTQLSDTARYDEALSTAIWTDLFAHLARWTSAPNGDLVTVRTAAEVNQTFIVKSIDVGDGKPYQYYLKLPSSYRKGMHLPLVIVTHGGNENAWLFTSKIKMHEVGEQEGFISVYPNGHRNRWESELPDGPDAQFIERMIKDVIKTYGADASRVYMMGFSNGSGMTHMMGLTHPHLFAATSPTNGAGTLSKQARQRVAELKARFDWQLPVMAIYGNVDSAASVDGLIPAGGSINVGIDTIKKYNHIGLTDKTTRLNSAFSAPYEVLTPSGQLVPAGIDARYPAGRFQVYQYLSDAPKPLDLLHLVWVIDMPHAYDLREAQLQWDYFKHWSRNSNGSLRYTARVLK